jgi:uncharacterized integral membrane protein (TIGR00698 family)
MKKEKTPQQSPPKGKEKTPQQSPPKGVDWSSLYKKEDWLAVWLAFLIMFGVLAGIALQIPSMRWVTDGELRTIIGEQAGAIEQITSDAQRLGETALLTEMQALRAAIDKQDRTAITKAADKVRTAARDVKDAELKKAAEALGTEIRAQARRELTRVLGWDNIQRILIIGAIYLVIASIGIFLIGGNVLNFALGFPVVFLLAYLAQFLAGNHSLRELGLEFVIWSLFLGLLISNLFKLPPWLKQAVQTEYFIKTGLVIFGASILFANIIEAGGLGIIQGVIVIFTVFYVAYWLLRKIFKLDDEFAAVMSSAVSVCGVSAAIAAHGAVKGDPKKLSYVTSLVLLIALPMMVLQPFIARLLGLTEPVAGAWMAGTIDTTAAVVVAGALYGEIAMQYASILKLTQNAMIGAVGFILAVLWTFKDAGRTPNAPKPRPIEVWYRMPKFVLGFIVASFIFSFLVSPEVVAQTSPLLTHLRVIWFAMAFVCIGLDTRFVDLLKTGGGRPALGFVTAQFFNVVIVLMVAYLLFGGVFFPPPF